MVSDAQVTVALRAACLHDTRESRKDMRKALEAALLSASPVQQEGAAPKGEWRPIATAPKDGRGLLLGHFNSHGKWRTLRGQWCSADAIAETWEEDAPEGWYETSVESDDLPNCWWTEPTHWMPLPTAPGATPARADAPIGEPTDARDAQRMDWLESHLTDANGIYLDGAAIVHPFAFDRETIGCGTLRAAIDAAMGATPIAAPAGQPALTRYSMGFFQGSPAMFQQPDGDYVRWSDVQAAPSVGQPATSSRGKAAPAPVVPTDELIRMQMAYYMHGRDQAAEFARNAGYPELASSIAANWAAPGWLPPLCGSCDGSGEREVFVRSGGMLPENAGDGHDETVNCPDCNGSGFAAPSADRAAAPAPVATLTDEELADCGLLSELDDGEAVEVRKEADHG
jgi:hypothetical protein